MVVSSLRFQFRPDRDGIQVTAAAETIEDAIMNVDPDSFDLISLDLFIPGHSPIENIRSLKQHFPGKPIIIYTSETSSSWKKTMMQEGALAFITKNASREELKIGILKASKGEFYYTGKSDLSDVNELSPAQSAPSTNPLTPVEEEIVKLLSVGMAHKEISDRMGISRSMLEKILKEIRAHFKVKNNIELIGYLTSNGFI
jgi:DNA-binding NarL/FixJ family response regulator